MSENGLTVDVIEKIEELVKASLDMTPRVLDLPDRRGVRLLVDANGNTQEIKSDSLMYRRVVLETPEELVRFVDADERPPEEGVVYYNQEQIVYLADAGEPRSIVTVPLIPGPQYQLLGKLAGAWLDQKTLIRTLRVELFGALQDNGSLLGLVRSLKFTSDGNVEANLQHGRESMGKSLREQVSGASALPEEIVVNVSVFENWRRPQAVRMAIDIDPATARFQLVPYPLELRLALDRTMDELGKFLNGTEGDVPAYRGKP